MKNTIIYTTTTLSVGSWKEGDELKDRLKDGLYSVINNGIIRSIHPVADQIYKKLKDLEICENGWKHFGLGLKIEIIDYNEAEEYIKKLK